MNQGATSSIESVRHAKFSYVLVPCEISKPAKTLYYEGTEKEFKDFLNRHFARDCLLKSERETFAKEILSSTKGNTMDEDQLNRAVELSQTTQIIPLTLPTPANQYEAINAYIDNIGRVKNLSRNARASRILSDDIRGDCFISKTFDDDNDFKRIDFTEKEYERFLEEPPNRQQRFSQAEALFRLQQQLAAANRD